MKKTVKNHSILNKKKLKGENGITLIALIITIIILVILAAVSIRAAYNSGIIDYGVNGTQKYIEEGKKEESTISKTESFMASILSKLDELENGGDENNDVPDLLKDYVLGKAVNGERPGKSLWDDLYVDYEFIPDEESITDADETPTYLTELWGDYKESELQAGYYYIEYDNVVYKIELTYDTGEAITRDVAKVYEPSRDEGKRVQYSVDSAAEEIEWLVLYDKGTTVDITPIVLDNEWGYELGWEDEAAIEALPTGTELERAIWSYNHAVETLNAYCGTIVTNSTAQAVRSVGTGFGITDTSTMYSSTFLANNPSGQYDEGDYNGVGKIGDMNEEQDRVRVYFWGLTPTFPTELWMNSRWINEHSGGDDVNIHTDFHIRTFYERPGGNVIGGIWKVHDDEAWNSGCYKHVRPVVRVSKDNVVFIDDDEGSLI